MCQGGRTGKNSSIVSATRLHLPPEATEIPQVTQQHLRAYVTNARDLGVTAAIAVNSHAEAVRAIAEDAAPGYKLHVLHVPCWGTFVPALNVLLDHSQRTGMTHILYQSLEVVCDPAVLQQMQNHFGPDVLVVGPELPGHTFEEGEQMLNGRTTPWNTLALWSVRKLALTGFLRIADGLPQGGAANAELVEPTSPKRQLSVEEAEIAGELLGSDTWWARQVTPAAIRDKDVPAGVEEVTAIALLQHLLGRGHAIAVLLKLPDNLAEKVSWKSDWGGDERRKQWHEYKMKSKVSRPQAQLLQLFKGSLKAPAYSNPRDGEVEGEEPPAENFGTVMHYGTTISPPNQVENICLAAVGIFYFSSTAVLASAFGRMNSALQQTPHLSVSMMIFMASIIGGVYVLMPISLQITRMVTYRFSHMAGLLFFAITLLLSHAAIIVSQLTCGEFGQNAVLLISRIAQGLGSGVLFQSRFVLASMSTSDHHTALQASAFMAGDLGLGLGALLPAATSVLTAYWPNDAPELYSTIVQAVICFSFLVWVLVAFPSVIHLLPVRARFADKFEQGKRRKNSEDEQQSSHFRWVVLISGTARVFVQSAIMPVVALLMHDLGYVGQFRQSIAVATIYLLQLPFEALATKACTGCSVRLSTKSRTSMGLSRNLLGSGAILITVISICSLVTTADKNLELLLRRLLQLAALMVMLAVAAPFNASRLYKLHDAERVIVTLEWMKAYVGRLLGPFFAILMYTTLGYGPLLACLYIAAVGVALTA
jgi:MFS family permease